MSVRNSDTSLEPGNRYYAHKRIGALPAMKLDARLKCVAIATVTALSLGVAAPVASANEGQSQGDPEITVITDTGETLSDEDAEIVTETVAVVDDAGVLEETASVEVSADGETATADLEYGASLEVPLEAGEPAVIETAAGYEISLTPVLENSSAETLLVDNVAVTPDVALDTTLITQPLDDGVRFMTLLESQDAPASAEYQLGLPPGAYAAPNEEGGLSIWHSTETGTFAIGYVDPAWAVDSEGKPVPTHYETAGDVIIQILEPTPEAVYPILADPKASAAKPPTIWAGFVEGSTTSPGDSRSVKVLLEGDFKSLAYTIALPAGSPLSLSGSAWASDYAGKGSSASCYPASTGSLNWTCSVSRKSTGRTTTNIQGLSMKVTGSTRTTRTWSTNVGSTAYQVYKADLYVDASEAIKQDKKAAILKTMSTTGKYDMGRGKIIYARNSYDGAQAVVDFYTNIVTQCGKNSPLVSDMGSVARWLGEKGFSLALLVSELRNAEKSKWSLRAFLVGTALKDVFDPNTPGCSKLIAGMSILSVLPKSLPAEVIGIAWQLNATFADLMARSYQDMIAKAKAEGSCLVVKPASGPMGIPVDDWGTWDSTEIDGVKITCRGNGGGSW